MAHTILETFNKNKHISTRLNSLQFTFTTINATGTKLVLHAFIFLKDIHNYIYCQILAAKRHGLSWTDLGPMSAE